MNAARMVSINTNKILMRTYKEFITIVEKFKPFFENEAIEKIGQNIKYDLKILSHYNIQIKGKLFDTMIAHYLINPDMRHNMDVLSETYLKYSPKSIEDLIGKKGKNQKTPPQGGGGG